MIITHQKDKFNFCKGKVFSYDWICILTNDIENELYYCIYMGCSYAAQILFLHSLGPKTNVRTWKVFFSTDQALWTTGKWSDRCSRPGIRYAPEVMEGWPKTQLNQSLILLLLSADSSGTGNKQTLSTDRLRSGGRSFGEVLGLMTMLPSLGPSKSAVSCP